MPRTIFMDQGLFSHTRFSRRAELLVRSCVKVISRFPEGFYRIELLNPNSRYHLSLRVDYPNAADIEQAGRDGRDLSMLGGDIMIHGGAESIGCIAIGDPAVEELFVLVARTGLDDVQLIIAPRDLRQKSPKASDDAGPMWIAELHEQVRSEMAKLTSPGPSIHMKGR